MSSRVLGIFPKSGKRMLEDAIGQFKGIISQIKDGIKKVQVEVAQNAKKAFTIESEAAKKASKLNEDSQKLTTAMNEASVVLSNLEAMLRGTITTIQVSNSAEEETIEDKSGDTTSEESNN